MTITTEILIDAARAIGIEVKKFFKRLFCRHPITYFYRNIYGDEINATNARSWHKCINCGATIRKGELFKGEPK